MAEAKQVLLVMERGNEIFHALKSLQRCSNAADVLHVTWDHQEKSWGLFLEWKTPDGIDATSVLRVQDIRGHKSMFGG